MKPGPDGGDRLAEGVLVAAAILLTLLLIFVVACPRAFGASCDPDPENCDTCRYSPSPVFLHDPNANEEAIDGYRFFYRTDDAGEWQHAFDVPCYWVDTDLDDIVDTYLCPSSTVGYPAQRGLNLTPGTTFQLAAKAYAGFTESLVLAIATDRGHPTEPSKHEWCWPEYWNCTWEGCDPMTVITPSAVPTPPVALPGAVTIRRTDEETFPW